MHKSAVRWRLALFLVSLVLQTYNGRLASVGWTLLPTLLSRDHRGGEPHDSKTVPRWWNSNNPLRLAHDSNASISFLLAGHAAQRYIRMEAIASICVRCYAKPDMSCFIFFTWLLPNTVNCTACSSILQRFKLVVFMLQERKAAVNLPTSSSLCPSSFTLSMDAILNADQRPWYSYDSYLIVQSRAKIWLNNDCQKPKGPGGP